MDWKDNQMIPYVGDIFCLLLATFFATKFYFIKKPHWQVAGAVFFMIYFFIILYGRGRFL